VDKIRSRVGDQVQVSGIRAQEALLTLIENEAVPLRLPEWAGGKTVQMDSSRLLFVCAGAFEGLYESVFARVIQGQGEQSLKTTTVSETGRIHEEVRFALRDWLRSEDLFAYGITPQFLSRFDAVVVLEPLGEAELYKIFVTSADSALRQSHAYFASQGIKLEMSESAARRVAAEAARQPRLGARALKEVFRRGGPPLRVRPPERARAQRGPPAHRGRGRRACPRPRPGRLRHLDRGWGGLGARASRRALAPTSAA
jgi:ATP-dependent Clp protease ATP-binding subunit ClpX